MAHERSMVVARTSHEKCGVTLIAKSTVSGWQWIECFQMSSVAHPERPQTRFTKRSTKTWACDAERRQFVSLYRRPMEYPKDFQITTKKDLTNLSQ